MAINGNTFTLNKTNSTVGPLVVNGGRGIVKFPKTSTVTTTVPTAQARLALVAIASDGAFHQGGHAQDGEE